jgi:rod shape-determining protein MreC
MALLDFRLKAGYLFLAVVVAHLVLITAQVNAKSGVPILEAVTFSAFAEVQRATASVTGAVSGVWNGYIGLRGVRAENEQLRRDLAQAQIQVQEQRALADRSRSLEAVLQLRNTVDLQTTAALIIGSAASPDFRTVTIDKGTLEGLHTDMAVLAPGGVVGRVVIAGPRASRIQLLVDRNAAAGALIERSRAQGVAVGATDDRLRLEYVSETSDVATGDVVVTSGIDGIYPKGFVIGTVDAVEKNGPSYRSISIRPAVNFSSLEDVLVVTSAVSSAPPTGREKPE